MMLATSLLMAVFAATGFAQATIPAGYRAVYMTSMQDVKFVIVPKGRTAGNTLVVLVFPSCMNYFYRC
jgi:hypothetical protein